MKETTVPSSRWRRGGGERGEKSFRGLIPARERDVLDAVLMSDRVHRASNAGC